LRQVESKRGSGNPRDAWSSFVVDSVDAPATILHRADHIR